MKVKHKPIEAPPELGKALELPASLAELEAAHQALEEQKTKECGAEIDAVLARHGFKLIPKIMLGPTGVIGSGIGLARKAKGE